jgi:hypothetical protein
MARGYFLAEKNLFPRAIKKFTEALEQDPADEEAAAILTNRSAAYTLLQRLGELLDGPRILLGREELVPELERVGHRCTWSRTEALPTHFCRSTISVSG